MSVRMVVRGLGLTAAAVLFVAMPSRADAQAVYGCVQKSSGQIRVVEQGVTCRPTEQPLVWNQVGPMGPQGIPGPVGPAGPQGVQGAQGIQGPAGLISRDRYYITEGPVITLTPGFNFQWQYWCNEGDLAMGGGYKAVDHATGDELINAPGFQVTNSRPIDFAEQDAPTYKGWRTAGVNGSSQTIDFTVMVTCVHPNN